MNVEPLHRRLIAYGASGRYLAVTSGVGRPRLRELRIEVGWTQQQLAEKLAHFAWTLGQGHAAVNADMVAKWERGVKGISRRYRTLLCQLFGVSAEQLGFAPVSLAASGRPVRDAESLVSMLDEAAGLLDQLGAGGTALGPHLLSAWNDTVISRRNMLGVLNPAATDPAGRARAATATIADLEQLAGRYAALFTGADPATLLMSIAAHVRMAIAALARGKHSSLKEWAMSSQVLGFDLSFSCSPLLFGRAW